MVIVITIFNLIYQADNLENAGEGGIAGPFVGKGNVVFGKGGGQGMIVMKYYEDRSYRESSHLILLEHVNDAYCD